MARNAPSAAETPVKAVYVVPSQHRAIRRIAAERDAKISQVTHDLLAEALSARQRREAAGVN